MERLFGYLTALLSFALGQCLFLAVTGQRPTGIEAWVRAHREDFSEPR